MTDVDDSPLDRRSMLKGAAGLGAVAAAAGVLGATYTASATAPIGGSLEGIGEFDVLSASWGASADPNVARDRPSVQNISLVKFTDDTTVRIVEALLQGRVIPSGSIAATPQDGPGVVFHLTGVRVVSYSGGGSTMESRLTENVTLSFDTLEFRVGDDPGSSTTYP